MADSDRRYTEKYNAVMKWLREVFGDEPVPSFHQTSDFIGYLADLMVKEKQAVAKLNSYAKFSEASVSDFSSDLYDRSSIIDMLALSKVQSSAPTEVANLSSIAHQLSLASLDQSSFILGLTDLQMEKHKTSSELETLRKLVNQVEDDLAAATKRNKQLENVLTELEHSKPTDKSMAELSRDTQFLQSKSTKYKADQKQQETKLAKSGVTSSLTHEKIVADYKLLQELQDKLDGTNEELSKFAGLPPDKDLALVKLEVARLELQGIESKLANEIDMYAL